MHDNQDNRVPDQFKEVDKEMNESQITKFSELSALKHEELVELLDSSSTQPQYFSEHIRELRKDRIRPSIFQTMVDEFEEDMIVLSSGEPSVGELCDNNYCIISHKF